MKAAKNPEQRKIHVNPEISLLKKQRKSDSAELNTVAIKFKHQSKLSILLLFKLLTHFVPAKAFDTKYLRPHDTI